MQRNYYIVGLILVVFFVISFLTNILGPIIPDIIDSFDLSLTMVSFLPFAFFVAYGVFSIPSGILVERYGEKPALVAAFLLAFAGAVLFAAFPGYAVSIVSLFLIGAGMAMLQVALNPLMRVAGGEEHFAFNLVVVQLVFGIASYISPLVYSYLVTRLDGGPIDNFVLRLLAGVVPPDMAWVSIYWVFALVSFLMLAAMIVVRLPTVELK